MGLLSKRKPDPKLGERVRDRVTGFEGIATARTEWLNGCVRYSVQGPVKDGKVEDAQYIDVEQLEVIGAGVTERRKPSGGDRLAPQERTTGTVPPRW